MDGMWPFYCRLDFGSSQLDLRAYNSSTMGREELNYMRAVAAVEMAQRAPYINVENWALVGGEIGPNDRIVPDFVAGVWPGVGGVEFAVFYIGGEKISKDRMAEMAASIRSQTTQLTVSKRVFEGQRPDDEIVREASEVICRVNAMPSAFLLFSTR